jgi:hypothetical protein
MLLKPYRNRGNKDHRHITFDRFDLGLIDMAPPTDPGLAGRGALVSRNADWDRRTIAKRKGRTRVTENAPGAILVDDYETDAHTDSGFTSEGVNTTEFVEKEPAPGLGGQSHKVQLLNAAGPGLLHLTKTLDLSGDEFDHFSVWIYAHALPASTVSYSAKLIFSDLAGPDNEFVWTIFDETDPPVVGLRRYYTIRRADMAETLIPDWTAIQRITLQLDLPGAVGDFQISIDNLTYNPARGQELIQFKRVSAAGFKGAKDTYAIVSGSIYRLNEITEEWDSLGALFDADSEVNHAVMNDRLFLCDGVNTNRKIMPDGLTVYPMGIATMDIPVGITPSASGGFLADGTHHVLFTYYSTITGVESGPDVRAGTPVVIAGGGGNGSIFYSGIPASTDPQVTHVRIYRKHPSSTVFQRVSADADGEVINGATTFTDTLASDDLGNEADVDLDAPSPMKFMAAWPEIGALAGVYAESPTLVNLSSLADLASPENWPVENAFLIGRDDNDEASALHYFRGRMLAGKGDAILVGIFVGGDEILVFKTAPTDRGPVSHKAMLTIENKVYYPAADGVHTYTENNQVQKVSSLQQRTWDSMVYPPGLRRACSVQNRKRYQYELFFQEIGEVQNSRAWKVHHNSVVADEVFTKGYGPGNTAAISVDNVGAMASVEVETDAQLKEIWILGSNGVVYRIDDGPSDDGGPIDFQHRTTLISPYGAAYTQRFIWLDLEMKQTSDRNLTVQTWYDFALDTPDDALTAKLSSDDAPLVGSTFEIGIDPVGHPLGNSVRLKLGANRARRIMLEFAQNGIADVEIYQYRLYMDPLGIRG